MSQHTRTLTALQELIQALDRRHPQGHREDEAGIAKDARVLRHQAVSQIEEMRRTQSLGDSNASELADAVMTDDGGRQD